MPERDTWSGSAAMDSTARASSVGSCDSVGSINSAFSDDSYDYLSAEEKECLMFLEETIDSLDAEADSGLSTDENERVEDSLVNSAVMAQQASSANITSNEDPKKTSTQSHEKHAPEPTNHGNKMPGVLIPTPLVLANGSSNASPKLGQKTNMEATKVIPPHGMVSVTGNASQNYLEKEGSQSNIQAGKEREHAETLATKKQTEKSTEHEVFLPPPEPFQDQNNTSKLGDSSAAKTGLGDHTRNQPSASQGHVEKTMKKAATSFSLLTPRNMELLKHQAALKGIPSEPYGQQDQSAGKHNIVLSSSPGHPEHREKASQYLPHSNPPVVEMADPRFRQGPPTAPKPKKLPSNIVVKQGYHGHVASTLESLEGVRTSAHAVLSNTESNQLRSSGSFTESSKSLKKPGTSDQQQARLEALKKLGLIRNEASRSHVASANTQNEGKLVEAPSSTRPDTPDMNRVKQTEAFVNKTRSSSQLNLEHRSGVDIVDYGLKPDVRPGNFKSMSLERSGVSLSNYFANNRNLETDSGKSYVKQSFGANVSPNFLRNNRSRPVSLGTGNDFVNLSVPQEQSIESEKKDNRRSLPPQISSRRLSKHGTDAKIEPLESLNELKRPSIKKHELHTPQAELTEPEKKDAHNPLPPRIATNKLTKTAPVSVLNAPRGSAHSVQIAPRNSTNEHRLEALKKLGLLKEERK